MSLTIKYKQVLLTSSIVLAMGSSASANKCLDAVFKMNTNPSFSIDPYVYVDSTYTKTSSQKFIYNNGKLVETHETGEKEQVLYIYHDADESSLKKTGLEYIITKCEAQDTLCYTQKIYQDGELYNGSLTIKAMPNYISQEIDEPAYHSLTELILKPDTLIQLDESYGRYLGYKVDMKSSKMVFVADSTDDTKCYSSSDGKINGTFSYNPTEKGFSISLTVGNLDHPSTEYFFIDTEKSSAIRKTVKPVKITPKTRYFDLLGRYKFTK